MKASTCGQRIVAALPLLWAKWVSLHDAAGNIYWHQGEVLGPAEREAMRVALESFVGGGAPARVNHPLQRDRTALLLRAEDDTNAFVGFVMLVVDDRWLRGKGTAAPDLPIPVVRAVREWGATLELRRAGRRSPAPAPTAEMKPPQVVALLEGSPRVDNAEADRFLEKLQAFRDGAARTAPDADPDRHPHPPLRNADARGRTPASASAPQELIEGARGAGTGRGAGPAGRRRTAGVAGAARRNLVGRAGAVFGQPDHRRAQATATSCTSSRCAWKRRSCRAA